MGERVGANEVDSKATKRRRPNDAGRPSSSVGTKVGEKVGASEWVSDKPAASTPAGSTS